MLILILIYSLLSVLRQSLFPCFADGETKARSLGIQGYLFQGSIS